MKYRSGSAGKGLWLKISVTIRLVSGTLFSKRSENTQLHRAFLPQLNSTVLDIFSANRIHVTRHFILLPIPPILAEIMNFPWGGSFWRCRYSRKEFLAVRYG
jgi:hypothetical protein